MPKRRSPTGQLYQPDLAEVHVDGYGFHWEGAAPSLLAWFEDCGVPKGGLVVDLGCGGGQWLAKLARAGYRACGVDVSESMIRIAKQNAPRAELLCGSFDEVPLPTCSAATSLGEPLNYLNSGPKIKRTLRNIYSALAPGGVFIFDVRHPASGPVDVRHYQRASKDWFCHSLIEEDYRTNRITRYITTFNRQTDGAYRRSEETHRLKVFSRSEMSKWLREIGFRVRTKRGYGDYQLGDRQSVFICRKPVK